MQVLLFTDADYLGFSQLLSRPAGPHRVATALRQAGYSVQVIDFFTRINWLELEKIIKKYVTSETLAVGFSASVFGKMPADLMMATNCSLIFGQHTNLVANIITCAKEQNPNTKIIVGGARSIYEDMPGIDFFVHSYADVAFVELLKYLKDPDYPFKARVSKLTPNALAIDGLHDYPVSDISQLTIDWHESDFITPNETLPIEISRGCIFKCSFCNYPLNGKKRNDYIKLTQTLQREFLTNYEKYGTTKYLYVEDTHNDNIAKLEQMRNIRAQLPFDLRYDSYLRLDLIHSHEETATLLRDGGLRGACFGMETLKHASGKSVGKGLAPEKQIAFLHKLREIWGSDVTTTSGFILGLPHDKAEDIAELFDWLPSKNNPLDSWYTTALAITNKKYFQKRGLDRLFYTELDYNYEKYGYRWVDGIDQSSLPIVVWQKDDINFLTLSKQSKEFMRKHLNDMPVLALTNIFLDSFGLTREETALPLKQILQETLYMQNRNAFLNGYVQKLLAQ